MEYLFGVVASYFMYHPIFDQPLAVFKRSILISDCVSITYPHMDLVAMVAAIGPLSKTVYSVVTTLCTIIDATPEINVSIRSLHEGLIGLSTVLGAITSNLRSP